MKTKHTFFILTMSVFALYHSEAQTLNDPIYINITRLPKTTFSSQNPITSTTYFEVNAVSPALKIGKSTKLYNSAYFRNTSNDVNNRFQIGNELPHNLSDIRYAIIAKTQVHAKWEMIVIPRLMLRSDLSQRIDKRDFFGQVALLANYTVSTNPTLKIGIGAALNNDFKRNAIVALGWLSYNSKKIKIEIVYPTATILYKHTDRFEFGIYSIVDGALSRVKPFEVNAQTAHYARTFQVLFAPTATHKIYKQLYGHLKVGIIPIRSIEALDSHYQAIKSTKTTLDSPLFFRIGVSYRMVE